MRRSDWAAVAVAFTLVGAVWWVLSREEQRVVEGKMYRGRSYRCVGGPHCGTLELVWDDQQYVDVDFNGTAHRYVRGAVHQQPVLVHQGVVQ